MELSAVSDTLLLKNKRGQLSWWIAIRLAVDRAGRVQYISITLLNVDRALASTSAGLDK